MLKEIGCIKLMEDKLKEQQIKLWHKCKRSPVNYLQRDTFDRWKNYIMKNDNNCIDKYANLIIDESRFYHVSNSPLSRCYKLVKSLHKPHQNIMLEKKESVMKSPATYSIEFPTNLHTIYEKNEMDRIIKYEKCYDFWTDGSCQPNPGPGGAAIFQQILRSKKKYS